MSTAIFNTAKWSTKIRKYLEWKSLSCNKSGFFVLRLKWRQIYSRLSELNLPQKISQNIKLSYSKQLRITCNLPSVLLNLLIFGTKYFDKTLLTRLMIHQSYFFINVLLINRNRLLALIDCISGSEICVYIVLQKNREMFDWKMQSYMQVTLGQSYNL